MNANRQRVRLLDASGGVKVIQVRQEPSVVVAGCFEGVEVLCALVRALGYAPRTAGICWPRDRMIAFGARYVSARHAGRLGQGGYYVFGADYAIVSTAVYQRRRDERLRRLSRFLGIPVHAVEPYRIAGAPGHLDLTVLTIPQRRLVCVDRRHYSLCRETFDAIARQHQSTIVPVDTGRESRRWPLNCLVLDHGGEPVVVANRRTPRFLDVLRELGLEHEVVDVHSSHRHFGSIRCRTNSACSPALFPRLGISFGSGHRRRRPAG